MKVRRDAWSHEDDLLLAQTTLRHIREGSTQVAAFEEVGDQLNRTSAACGYRWNTEIRPRYLDAIASAKKQRKENNRRTDHRQQQSAEAQAVDTKELAPEVEQNEPTLTLEDCITFLSTYSTKDSPELSCENDELIKENNRLKKENEELTLKYHQLISNKEKLIDEYSLFMTVINQASTIEEKENRNMLIN